MNGIPSQGQEFDQKIRVEDALLLSPEQNKILDEALNRGLIWKPTLASPLLRGKCLPELRVYPKKIAEFISRRLSESTPSKPQKLDKFVSLVYGGTVFQTVRADRNFLCSDVDLRFIQTSTDYSPSLSFYITYIKIQIIQKLLQKSADTFMIRASEEVVNEQFLKVLKSHICTDLELDKIKPKQIDRLVLSSYSSGKSSFLDLQGSPRALLIQSPGLDLEFIAKPHLPNLQRYLFDGEGLVIDITNRQFRYDNGVAIAPEGAGEAIDSIKRGELSLHTPEKFFISQLARRLTQGFSIRNSEKVCQIAVDCLKSSPSSSQPASDHFRHQIELHYRHVPFAQTIYYLNLLYCFVHSSAYSKEHVESYIKQWQQQLKAKKKYGLISLTEYLLNYPTLFSELMTLVPGLLLLFEKQNEHIKVCVCDQIEAPTVHHISIASEKYFHHLAIDSPVYLATKFICAWKVLAKQLTHQELNALMKNLVIDFRLKLDDFPQDLSLLMLSFTLQKMVERLKMLKQMALADAVNSLSKYLKNPSKFKAEGRRATRVILQEAPQESAPSLFIQCITQGCETVIDGEKNLWTKYLKEGLNTFSRPYSILRIYPAEKRGLWLRQLLSACKQSLNAFNKLEELLEICDHLESIEKEKHLEDVEKDLYALKASIYERLLKAINNVVLDPKNSNSISLVYYQCFLRATQGPCSADSLNKTWSAFLRQPPSLATRAVSLSIAESFAQRSEQRLLDSTVKTVFPMLASPLGPFQQDERASLRSLLPTILKEKSNPLEIENLLKLLSNEAYFNKAIPLIREIVNRLDPQYGRTLKFKERPVPKTGLPLNSEPFAVQAQPPQSQAVGKVVKSAPSAVDPLSSLRKLADNILQTEKVEKIKDACHQFVESLCAQKLEFFQTNGCKELVDNTIRKVINHRMGLDSAFYLLGVMHERQLLALKTRIDHWILLMNKYLHPRYNQNPPEGFFSLGLRELLLTEPPEYVYDIERMALPYVQVAHKFKKECLQDPKLLRIFIERTSKFTERTAKKKKPFENYERWMNTLLELISVSADPQFLETIISWIKSPPFSKEKTYPAIIKYLNKIIVLQIKDEEKIKKLREIITSLEAQIKTECVSPEVSIGTLFCGAGFYSFYGSSEQDVIKALSYVEKTANPSVVFLQVLNLLNNSMAFKENSGVDMPLIQALAHVNTRNLEIPLAGLEFYIDEFYKLFNKAFLAGKKTYFPCLIYTSLICEIQKCRRVCSTSNKDEDKNTITALKQKLDSVADALINVMHELIGDTVESFSKTFDQCTKSSDLSFLIRKFIILYPNYLVEASTEALQWADRVYGKIKTLFLEKRDLNELNEREQPRHSIFQLLVFLQQGILLNLRTVSHKELFTKIEEDWNKQKTEYVGSLNSAMIPFGKWLLNEFITNEVINGIKIEGRTPQVLLPELLKRLQLKENASHEETFIEIAARMREILEGLKKIKMDKNAPFQKQLAVHIVQFAHLYAPSAAEQVKKILAEQNCSIQETIDQGLRVLIAHQLIVDEMTTLVPVFNKIKMNIGFSAITDSEELFKYINSLKDHKGGGPFICINLN